MVKYDDLNALIDDLDTATTALGVAVDALIADINKTATEGLNGPQTENVLTRLATLSNTLKTMGSNASNPLPPPPPPPPAMPGPLA